MIRQQYRQIRKGFRFYRSVNWAKTLYFNFSKFPFAVARKLPVYFYGSVRFTSIKGQIVIDAPIKSGMIGFGQPYEIISRPAGIAEICLEGKMVFKGHVQFGIDYFVYIAENASCEMGHMSSIGGKGKLICYEKITLAEFARVGFESQIIDTTFHQMTNTMTGEKFPTAGAIAIGSYNYFGNRVSVMPFSVTPDYCTVASNSLCNKDYSGLGQKILIGGMPARLLKEHIVRDWEFEKESLEKWLIV